MTLSSKGGKKTHSRFALAPTAPLSCNDDDDSGVSDEDDDDNSDGATVTVDAHASLTRPDTPVAPSTARPR